MTVCNHTLQSKIVKETPSGGKLKRILLEILIEKCLNLLSSENYIVKSIGEGPQPKVWGTGI